jgi:hypothetical protein
LIIPLHIPTSHRITKSEWGGKSYLQKEKGVGIGKGWAQLEGSFEIEKYKDALHISWRVTPGL